MRVTSAEFPGKYLFAFFGWKVFDGVPQCSARKHLVMLLDKAEKGGP
jgi:hypothetical protein